MMNRTRRTQRITAAAAGVAGLAVACGEAGTTRLVGLEEGLVPGPRVVEIAPEALRLPTVRLGCGGSEGHFEVRNFTSGPVRIVRGRERDPSDVFGIDWPGSLPNGALTISSGGRARVPVRFRPREVGEFEGEVELEVALAGQSVQRVRLSGRAVDQLSASDTFEQLPSLNVDVVFIIDNSTSMRQEQRGLRESFRSFVRAADDGFTDYRVAVTTTDVDDESGRFVPVSEGVDLDGDGVPDDLDGDGDADADDRNLELLRIEERQVDRSSQPTPQQVFRRLADVGVSGSEFERGLEAALLALSPSRTEAANAFFFRDDALLSLIFVSDEQDQSPRTVDEYVAAYRALAPSRRVTASAVVGPEPNGCEGEDGEASAGPRYIEVARRLGGGTASICTDDWGETLQQISGVSFGLRRVFRLSGFADGMPRVFINGRERPAVFDTGRVNWTYDASERTVEFTVEQTPPLESVIRIDYELACAP